eukprot:CAMPEP_0176268758 /NCGR_PEP_ID=MMETSP0121_2-20121125/43841_1 /TAXON_ID=160619 /ORGANISM="Kryptoperidinium foliaceum, Strain CCMP 1326" /LENGTH=176 /DNA_ID=CAMNT_0017608865 /DNA_START=48 /DNA_END=576 /DNA_ORIENTATION=+
MTFAAFGRWARPRNVHLSLFNRRLAVDMKMARGLASSPILRLAAECRPIGGFVEQRGTVPICAGGQVSVSEGMDDSSAAAASQVIEAVVRDLMELDSATVTGFSEMLDISVLASTANAVVDGCQDQQGVEMPPEHVLRRSLRATPGYTLGWRDRRDTYRATCSTRSFDLLSVAKKK